MKNVYRKMILLISAAMLSIAAIGCGVNSNLENKVKSFAGERVEQIYINTDGQNIKLYPSSDEQVKLSMKTDKELSAVLEDNVLTVNVAPPSGYVNFKTATLYVEIPTKNYETISLVSTSGNISVEKVKAEELIATADSGNITIKGLKGEVDAATDSGKIKSSLVNSSAITSIGAGYMLNATIGETENHAPRLKLRSVSGSITLD